MSSTANTEKAAIDKFIEEACTEFKSGKGAVFSRHIDEILTYPLNPSDVVACAARLFKTLLEAYDNYSDNMMALLVLQTIDSVAVDYRPLSDLLEGTLKLGAPPSLYLLKRLKNTEPYIVEEYKRPIDQEIILPDEGCVYAYFRAFKNRPDDVYEQGFYFEHYPQGETDYVWK